MANYTVFLACFIAAIEATALSLWLSRKKETSNARGYPIPPVIWEILWGLMVLLSAVTGLGAWLIAK
jgi:hypothetical protein